MDRDSIAHGPAGDILDWAAYRATVNEQKRTKATSYFLLDREMRKAVMIIDAQDSTIVSQDTLIEYQTGRIYQLAEECRKCKEKKPGRLWWMLVGFLAGGFVGYSL